MSLEVAFEIAQASQQVKRIADVLTASQKDVFVRLPGLLAYWPGSIRDRAGAVVEHSGSGIDLAEIGECPTAYDGNAFVHLGNGTNYLDTTGSLAVTGTETHISSSIRGLTLGAWVMVDTQPATVIPGIMAKDGVNPLRGYGISLTTDLEPFFSVSGNGASTTLALAQAVVVGSWNFIVGRFLPSTEVATFVNADKTVNTTAVPASINISTVQFNIGRRYVLDTAILHGKVRDAFVCASALDDEQIEELRLTSVP